MAAIDTGNMKDDETPSVKKQKGSNGYPKGVSETLPARGEAAGGERVAEAAQVAGEGMLRSRVGLCDRAARQ